MNIDLQSISASSTYITQLLVDGLTPNVFLIKLACTCSISLDILEPYVLLPYNKIGLISVSNTCSLKLLLTGKCLVCII